MSAITIQQMAERVSDLLETRLGLRGKTLDQKLARGGRILPRKVRKAAHELARAAEMSRNPKLLLQIDEGAVAGAYDICLRHLSPMGARARRLAMFQGALASMLFGALVIIALLLIVLKWRGYF